MKVSTLISVVLVNSCIIISGCQNRAPSLRMLDGRADYDDPRTSQDITMKEGGVEGFRNHPVPVRSRPKVAAIWIHPHEMASHDYFWGGWMSCVIEQDQWILTKPGKMPAAPGIVDVTQGVTESFPKGVKSTVNPALGKSPLKK